VRGLNPKTLGGEELNNVEILYFFRDKLARSKKNKQKKTKQI